MATILDSLNSKVNNTPGVTPFGTMITNLQGMIDNKNFDNTDFLNSYMTDLNNFGTNVDTKTNELKRANAADAKYLGKTTAQSVLDSLASRNMLRGSVASDTLSNALGQIARNTAQTNSLAEAQGAQAKLAIPEMKRDLLNTQAQVATQQLIPYEMLLKALEIDQYKYAQPLGV